MTAQALKNQTLIHQSTILLLVSLSLSVLLPHTNGQDKIHHEKGSTKKHCPVYIPLTKLERYFLSKFVMSVLPWSEFCAHSGKNVALEW